MRMRRSTCRNCARLAARVAELERQLATALTRIEQLEKELACARKDSSTSSKPPSSDIVKPPKPPAGAGKGKGRGKRKRKRGGQPGHPRHTRPLFPPEQVDHAWLYQWPQSSLTPEWEPLDEFRIQQQVELVEKLFEVTEHRARLYRHRQTGELVAAPLPQDVLRAGLVGPRLSALVAYQKGACHMSYSVIQGFLGDVVHLPLSTGQLAKVVQKASAALGPCYDELQAVLPQQSVLNVDETGHPENGRDLWTWGFHSPGPKGFTFFHIDPSRSSDVLKEFLGQTFAGIVGCDYLSAYRKFLRETDAVMQFCWAHLIRDVKFLTTLLDKVTRNFGARLLAKIKLLFRTWHRRGSTPEERWRREARRAQQAVLKAVRRPPCRSEAQNIAKRFRDHGRYYFTFLEVPGVEPTNNAMERGFRQLIIDRKVTQGTRGERGRRWCERIWTVLATCAQQGRSAFEFVHQSILAHLTNQTAPSLLPLPP
jgi:transposase